MNNKLYSWIIKTMTGVAICTLPVVANATDYNPGEVPGICVYEHTLAYSGTSDAITALWCANPVTPAHGSCSLDSSTPGQCSYVTNCDTGYYISGEAQTTNEKTVVNYSTVLVDGANGCMTCSPRTTQVTLNKQSGTGGTTTITATYDAAMPTATMPTRAGYSFGGYYTETGCNGTQYYTAAGASARNWNSVSTTVLYACWNANSYTCESGKYLRASDATCATCAAGNYCPGATYTYNGSDQGVTACATLGTGYTSDAGASANTGCYLTLAGKVRTATTGTATTDCNAGYYKASHKEYYGTQYSCDACTGATYSTTSGANACTTCPTATNSTNVTGYSYYNTGATGDHTKREGCYANFKAITLDDAELSAYHCYIDASTDNYGVAATGKICWVNKSELKCNGGYYNSTLSGSSTQFSGSTISALHENVCTPVGAGYWSADEVLTRSQCSAGLTTIGYGKGADEAGDCGRKLHIGDNIMYMRSVKKTTPSLNIDTNGDGIADLFGNASMTEHNMSANVSKKYKTKKDSTVYYIYDDSAE